MGHLIPAGTGYTERLKFTIKKLGKEVIPESPLEAGLMGGGEKSDGAAAAGDALSPEDASSADLDAIAMLGLDPGGEGV